MTLRELKAALTAVSDVYLDTEVFCFNCDTSYVHDLDEVRVSTEEDEHYGITASGARVVLVCVSG